MTIENANYKEKVLRKNAKDADVNLINYINHSAQNDPGFYRWLFGPQASERDDFVCPDRNEFNLFCQDLME